MKIPRLDKILREAPVDIEVPFEVWTCFGSQAKVISIAGQDASLGEDYVNLFRLRRAIEWYAKLLGAKTLKWED